MSCNFNSLTIQSQCNRKYMIFKRLLDHTKHLYQNKLVHLEENKEA